MNILEIPQKEIVKGYKGRFVHMETFTLAFWEVEAGAEIPIHSHVHEQTTQVIEGEFPLFWTNKKEFRTKWEARDKASLIQGIAWVVGKNLYSVHDMRFIW